MAVEYHVLPYTHETLLDALVRLSGARLEDLARKGHCSYLSGYLDQLSAETILIEPQYVDRDFLDDYSGYYVKCFREYKRTCARIHVFDKHFGEEQFAAFLRGEESDVCVPFLQESYLGFVVVKPLPQTVIGRTCLRTYPSDQGRRQFPALRCYEANLFGQALSVQSLAFQEQDNEVAACATSALWSAFQATSVLFQHHPPSPVEITEASVRGFPERDRAFPAMRGLSVDQMASAVRSVGLEPECVSAEDRYVLRSCAYAYLRAGIPVLLLVNLFDQSRDTQEDIGFHAVVVAGFSLRAGGDCHDGHQGIRIKAFGIDKFYVHDDQVGPFAKMECTGGPFLRTSWPSADGYRGNIIARPEILIVPLYHKIRIPIETVLDKVLVPFDWAIEGLRVQGWLPFPTRLEWDLFLTTVNDLKKSIQEMRELRGDARRRVLIENMPKFLWRATGLSDGRPVLDLLFDATDLRQGRIFLRAIEYDQVNCGLLRVIAPHVLGSTPHLDGSRTIWEWFGGRVHSGPQASGA